MPRYYLNVRHRPGPAGLAVDPEGEEFADVSAARESALSQAREMIARERHTFIRDWMDCSFEIMDEAGQPVLTIPFSDTVPESDWD
ncbi:hypothetical protein [Methylobacterium sp. GC_Met_2]|uniref:DUF6894 family protein n=1 Tax=Methylobacterium sp. GC_Met_2 TaxID=2937376 RepID=UPI00226B7205|nr:hypothetical protein [Methylobacterium sp. GC_Met_2]